MSRRNGRSRPNIWEQHALNEQARLQRESGAGASQPGAGAVQPSASAAQPAAQARPNYLLVNDDLEAPSVTVPVNRPRSRNATRRNGILSRLRRTLSPFIPSMPTWISRRPPSLLAASRVLPPSNRAARVPHPGNRPPSPLAVSPLAGMPNFSQEGFASARLRMGESPRVDPRVSGANALPHAGEGYGSLQFNRKPLVPKSTLNRRRRQDPTMTDILNDDSLAQQLVSVLEHATMGLVALPEGRANLMPAREIFEPDRPLCQVLVNLKKFSARERFHKVYNEIPFVEREAQLFLAIKERKQDCETKLKRTTPSTEEYNLLRAEYEYLIAQETSCKLKLSDLKAFQVSQTNPEYHEIDSTFKIIASRLDLCMSEYREKGRHNPDDLNSIGLLIDQVASLLGQGIIGKEYAKLNKNVVKKMMDYLAHFKLLQLCYKYGDVRGYELLRRIELSRSLEVVFCVRGNVDRAGLYEVELWSLSPSERAQLLRDRIIRFIHRSSRTIILAGEQAVEVGKSVATTIPPLVEGIRSISRWEGLKAAIRHTLVVARDALSDLYQAAKIDPNREHEPNVTQQFVELVEASQDETMREAALMLLHIGQAAEIEQEGKLLPRADEALEGEASRIVLGNVGPTGIFEVLPHVEEGRETPRARYMPNSGLGGFDHSTVDKTTNNQGSRKRKSNKNRNNIGKEPRV